MWRFGGSRFQQSLGGEAGCRQIHQRNISPHKWTDAFKPCPVFHKKLRKWWNTVFFCSFSSLLLYLSCRQPSRWRTYTMAEVTNLQTNKLHIIYLRCYCAPWCIHDLIFDSKPLCLFPAGWVILFWCFAPFGVVNNLGTFTTHTFIPQ